MNEQTSAATYIKIILFQCSTSIRISYTEGDDKLLMCLIPKKNIIVKDNAQ